MSKLLDLVLPTWPLNPDFQFTMIADFFNELEKNKIVRLIWIRAVRSLRCDLPTWGHRAKLYSTENLSKTKITHLAGGNVFDRLRLNMVYYILYPIFECFHPGGRRIHPLSRQYNLFFLCGKTMGSNYMKPSVFWVIMRRAFSFNKFGWNWKHRRRGGWRPTLELFFWTECLNSATDNT